MEEIEQIAQEAASKVTGMHCNCKNIEPFFLDEIRESFMPKDGRSLQEDEKVLLSKLDNLAKDCGYELGADGHYIQFPKQETIIQKIGPYTIIKEHDDGDLTLDTRNWGKIIVTSEGEVFYEETL